MRSLEVLLSPHFGLDGIPKEDKTSTKCQSGQEKTDHKAFLCFLPGSCLSVTESVTFLNWRKQTSPTGKDSDNGQRKLSVISHKLLQKTCTLYLKKASEAARKIQSHQLVRISMQEMEKLNKKQKMEGSSQQITLLSFIVKINYFFPQRKAMQQI